jgi:hypothetical protein
MIPRLAAIFGLVLLGAEQSDASDVVVRRVPNGGIKASAAVDEKGKLHLVYFSGEPSGGDAWYVTSQDGGTTYSEPLRVNSQPSAVLGASSARGPHLALGNGGRVHAIWMGSSKARPRAPLNPAMPADSPFNGTPLLYAYLDATAKSFTEQRNLMTKTVALDGDSAVAADRSGNVYVVWHAQLPGGKGEKDRSVWLTRSKDAGATFSEERNVLTEPTGACACCSVIAQTATNGDIAILYRSAVEPAKRGMRLLHSNDRGETFKLTAIDEWTVPMCPMSTASIISTTKGFLGAWEVEGRIGFGRLPGASSEQLSGKVTRKHPSLAIDSKGETLLAWVEGISFGKGGSVCWQLFDVSGKPVGEQVRNDGLPGNGNVAAVALADAKFAVIY